MLSLLTLLHADLAIMHTNYTDWGLGSSIAAPDESSRTLEGEHLKKNRRLVTHRRQTTASTRNINTTHETFLYRL